MIIPNYVIIYRYIYLGQGRRRTCRGTKT